MLSFALKLVWFCLSSTGIVACWIVIYTFSRIINCYWILLYPAFTTLLEGIFCLGMIYDMNPFQMPKAFCVAQTFVIYYSAWTLTGVCSAFTCATAGSVLWPSLATGSAATSVAWRNRYYFPIVVFPLACLSVSLPVLLRIDAIQPTDDLHCDASRPEWGRFLGYAGLSMILTLPCFFLCAAAARVILITHLRSRRTRLSFRNHMCRLRLPSLQGEGSVTLEKSTPPLPWLPDAKSASSPPDSLDSLKPTSSSVDGQGATFPTDSDIGPSGTADELSLSREPSGASDGMRAIEEGLQFDPPTQVVGMSMSLRSCETPPPLPSLTPAMWRLLVFQMIFFVIQWLAALSTVIDVIQHRPTPTPFGSQHVALVLVGWGPALVFGHLPSVRRVLMLQKK